MNHHLGYAPGVAKPASVTNQRNGKGAKTVLRRRPYQLLIDDACDNRIIQALSGMPVLVAQLLRLANCSGTANPKRATVCSLHHALAAIGTNQLFQWCSLLLYNHTGPGVACRDPLVALAIQRASLMLRLALLERPRESTRRSGFPSAQVTRSELKFLRRSNRLFASFPKVFT